MNMATHLEFDGKVVLVTGAATGIGWAACDLFLQRGAKVMFADIDPMLPDTVGRLKDSHQARAHCVQLDVGQATSVDLCVSSVLERFGKLDVLVNVAGIYPAARLIDMSDALFDQVLNVNLKGVFYMCRACLPHMLEQGSGAIVNVTSGAARRPLAGLSAYAASKAGVVALSQALALEVAPNVRVNLVSPGATASQTVRSLLEQGGHEAAEEAVANIPMGRLASPHDIADAIVYLASDRSCHSTGSTISVNGGSLFY